MPAKEKLYIESIDGHDLTPKDHTAPILQSNLREATQEQILLAEEQFEKTGMCKKHLIYDKSGISWSFRYCGICGAYLGLI